jgi:hypothetical protein
MLTSPNFLYLVEVGDAVEEGDVAEGDAAEDNTTLRQLNSWEIASRLGIQKLDVASACETMGVKIKPCQLGAF